MNLDAIFSDELIALKIHISKRLALFSGDIAQMHRNVELGEPVAICHDVVKCREVLVLAGANVDVLIPGHAPEILSRFSDGWIA